MKYYMSKLKDVVSLENIITFFHQSFESDYFFSGETHDFWEFVYVKSGTVGVTADERILELSEGQLIFHKPMEFHKIWSSRGTSPQVFVFSFKMGNCDMKLYENSVFLLDNSQQQIMNIICNEAKIMFDGYDRKKNSIKLRLNEGRPLGTDQLLKNFIEILFISLGRNKICGTNLNQSFSSSAIIYNDVINYLEKNIHSEISVEDICINCKCSKSNLKKIFNKYTGHGVMKHYIIMKLNRAKLFLDAGYTVGETAEKLSFSSPYYFSVAFKREMNMTPSEYSKKKEPKQ